MTSLMLAARLLGVSAALLLLPGLMLLTGLRVKAEWPHRIVLAFALSYSWVFVLSIVVPLCQWTVDYAGALTVVLLLGLGTYVARDVRPRARAGALPSRQALLVAAVIGGCAVCAWVIEPPFTGEEALDLASVWRFADGETITFDNTSLLPNTRPTYLFQPYQLAVGLISRWSRTDPIVAFVKLRFFLAPLTLIFLYCLLRWLAPTRMETSAAFVIVVLFIVFNFTTAQWNSWFPFVRRGGVGAGICVPVLMVLCLAATRRAEVAEARLARRVALGAAPIMLCASLATHPLEMFTLLFFAGGLALAVIAGLDPAGARKPALLLMLSFAVVTGAYLSILRSAVPEVATYRVDEKRVLWEQLATIAGDPLAALAGRKGVRHLLTSTLTNTTASVFGIPALALVALRAPAAAATLAFGIVPLTLLYASSAGFIVLKLITSPDVVTDVNPYFGLLGLLSLAIGLTALIQAALQAAAWRSPGGRRAIALWAIVSIVALAGGNIGVRWFANRTFRHPELLLFIALAVTLGVILIARRGRALLPPAPFPAALVIVLAASLALPLAAPHWAFGGKFGPQVTLMRAFRDASQSPSVLDWPSYYDTLKRSIAPPIPVPEEVVTELRKRIPPRKIVLADPRYSCALVVLFDGYCINPERLYNRLYFRAAERYHTDYVQPGHGGILQHPFFNRNPMLTTAESRLLSDYQVAYLLTDPESTDQTASKLERLGGATLEFARDGYRLYRINGS